jgi:hypothetical protein
MDKLAKETVFPWSEFSGIDTSLLFLKEFQVTTDRKIDLANRL